jgi:signal transduction histidine kinase
MGKAPRFISLYSQLKRFLIDWWIMDSETLATLTHLCGYTIAADWKKSFNEWLTAFRKQFVFDNVAIYVVEENNKSLEVAFARAAGRGRNKEAEASWGEEIANQVISTRKAVQFILEEQPSADRTTRPYLLGLPLFLLDRLGALAFVRFGGPEYADDQMPLAVLASIQATRALEQNNLQQNLAQLDHARHLAQLQDEFMATISHELHSPLGFIKGYTTSLLRSDTNWDTATQQEFLTIIDEESDHLLNLIDLTLDSARLQSGNLCMDFQPVRLDSLLRDVVQRIQGRKKDLDIRLDLTPAPPIQADNVRLAEVFDNLLDNAIKYAPGKEVTISLQSMGNWQVITFADHGPGISPDHVPFLFEKFYRAPSQYGKSGAGLGLFICKQIVQAHHGQISVKTSPGKGAAFRIELPVHPG